MTLILMIIMLFLNAFSRLLKKISGHKIIYYYY